DMVGDFRAKVAQQLRRGGQQCSAARLTAEIHVEIFDLAGPVAEDLAFDAAAGSPARMDRIGASGHTDRRGASEPGHEARALDLAIARAAGGVEQHRRRRDCRAQAPAQRSEPIHTLTQGDSRCADTRGRGYGAGRQTTTDRRGGLLTGPLDVGFDAEDQTARLPVVSTLRAKYRAFESELGPCGREQEARCAVEQVGSLVQMAPPITTVEADVETAPDHWPSRHTVNRA